MILSFGGKETEATDPYLHLTLYSFMIRVYEHREGVLSIDIGEVYLDENHGGLLSAGKLTGGRWRDVLVSRLAWKWVAVFINPETRLRATRGQE